MIANGARSAWAAGFTSIAGDCAEPIELAVTGRLPEWLSGVLLRNGPARFELGRDPCRHWFDGLALLHRFELGGGRVSYCARFLESADFTVAAREGRRAYSGFASEPRRGLGAWLMAALKRPPPSENANVNIAAIGGATVALTEAPALVEVAPETLETRGAFRFDDALPLAGVTTAHPLVDRAGNVFNVDTCIALRSTYRVWRISSGARRREVVAEVPADAPAYVHSFGLSASHVIIAEGPLVVRPVRFLLPGTPFIENFAWRPERGGRFRVVSLADGSARTFEHEPFFTFHFVNAFEEGGDVFADVAAYDDAEIVRALYLDRLRSGAALPAATLRRYRFSGGRVTAERIGAVPIELPRVAYRAAAGVAYGYAYGVSTKPEDTGFPDHIVKIDVRSGAHRAWCAGAYTGEPVFVARPGASAEDDGVLLVLVLDASTARSALVVLDAVGLEERARCTLPYAVPFGFHGQFTANAAA